VGPAVFAVFTGNYQRRTVSQPRESSIAAAQRTKKQRKDGDTDLLGEKNAEAPDASDAT
jgi:hypothetical protein